MKILVVEDDFIVRKGIILSLDWEKEGFQICGEAANGITGFELAKELQPDIILTDIRMPREDGLSLSKRVRCDYPWMKIVILSGYDDFSYAKQALQIGVFEYLLKPINADELLETVVKLKKEIEKERAREEREIFQQTFVEENYDYVRSRLLNALISEKLTDQARKEEVTGQLRKLGLGFAGPRYRVLLISVDDFFLLTQHSVEERRCLEESIEESIRNILALSSQEAVFRDNGTHFVVILMEQGQEEKEYREDLHRLYQQIKDELGFYITVSLGELKERMEEIRQSYREALQALRCRPYMPGEFMIQYREDMGKERKTYLNIQKKEHELVQAMLQYDGDRMLNIVQNIFEEAYQKQTEFDKVKTACVRIWMIVASNLEEMSINPVEVTGENRDCLREMEDMGSFSALKRYILNLCRDTVQVLNSTEGAKYNVIIQKSMQYIAKHYMEEIRISQIVAELYITPNHFSQVFKSQTGMNFSDYLNQYRIDIAKELLKNLDLKIYQVSEMAGYQNYKYFNLVFKKYTGYSPKEYRNHIYLREDGKIT